MKNAHEFYFNLESTNLEQRLFVMTCGGGYSCLGFDVCEKRIKRLLKEVNSDMKDLPPNGSVDQFYLYNIITEYVRELNKTTGFRSQAELNPKLIGYEGKRIEAKVYGEVSRFIVGRSTGWIPCHLEIKTKRSSGGCGLPSDPDQIEVLKVIY